MTARRLGAAAMVAVCLALVGAAQPPAPLHLGEVRTIAATTNHAAIVVDTGKEVKKFCLAFPEDEISGSEALRRIDSQVVFANFGSRGQAVCSLCGTGCPSSNCFCDPNKFWAYHRAGPGGAPYAFSRAGASSTVVRNGDVEGWKWGGGEPPPPATVGEVCSIEEPPPRSTGASSASTTTSTTDTVASTTTTGPPGPGSDGASSSPSAAPTSTPNAPSRILPGSAGSAPAPAADPSPTATTTTAVADSGAVASDESRPGVEGPAEDAAGESSAGSKRAVGRSQTEERKTDRGPGGFASLAVFAAALAGILVWRRRVKRSRSAAR